MNGAPYSSITSGRNGWNDIGGGCVSPTRSVDYWDYVSSSMIQNPSGVQDWIVDGCTSELDYTEQSSWLLFLKYLDALEQDREQEAKLVKKKYEYILDKKFRWSTWAAPRNAQGAIDYNTALTGEDLIEFVNGKLFPYLKGFKQG